ncbi:uncharacterized protein LOC126899366 [Daktulosphaira vitifoliae]|uniref:uncharacterized protein LOC126899366 n=1 Tax=Daktulosphaira vitifoliae TaxID=58002 RepID=UPI0021A9B8F3|nr:uncharacterized protein LOC126899366 [Daktulosphaira vitifoliae]XP_050530201.1 uncharacterized protein LOC126899366 [Daktulosphaira vitifoliae]
MHLMMMIFSMAVYLIFILVKRSGAMTHPRVKMYGPKVTIVDHRNPDPTIIPLDIIEEAKTLSQSEPYANEPSCLELRIMWRLSQRQKQLLQTANNNIPDTTDLFSYSIWDDYTKPRYSNRQRSLIMGRSLADRYQVYSQMRPFDKVARLSGTSRKFMDDQMSRKVNLFRLGYPISKMPGSAMRLTTKDRFQELKELIRHEKAKQYQSSGTGGNGSENTDGDSIPVIPLTDLSPNSPGNKRPGYQTLMSHPRHFSYGQFGKATNNKVDDKLSTASPPQYKTSPQNSPWNSRW